MKKYFSIAVLCALAVLGLGSCAKDIEEEIVTEQTGVRTVTFSASLADQTKTGLSMKFVPNWINTSLENVHLFETCGSEVLEGVDVEMRVPEDRNNEVAYFKADFAEEISIIVNPPSSPTSVVTRASEEYTYTGIVAQKVDGKFTVPATQYPDPVSLIDPNADFLVGDTKTTFSESMALKEMDIYFVRPVSVSRLAIMNIEGQKVKTVKITADNGVKLTGSAAYSDVNFSAGTVAWDNSGSNVITISYGDGKDIPAEATFYAYFISLPGSKKIMSVEVTTDQYVYIKSFTSGKTLVFNTTEFKNIAVDMSKVTPTSLNPEEPQDQNITFHKDNGIITADSFTLGSGTYVLPTLEGVAEGATVTWTLTESNPAGVANLTEAGGVWTLTPEKAGTVKVNAIASAVEGFNQTTVSYTLTVSNAGTQTLVFTPASLTVTLGEEFTEPALTGNKTAVTYSIDPEGVATIDATNGELTLVAAGNATVTATAAAGLASDGIWYAEATKTYALTVNEPAPVVTTTYTLVNKQEDMVDGNYLIVAADDDKVFNGSGDFQGGFATISTTEAITLSGETITISGEKAAYEFAFAKSGNGYTITGAQGQIVAAAHSNASTSTETYITFAETGGSVFLLRGKLASDDKALLFSTTRDTSSEEYIYFNTSYTIFKIGGSGSTRGAHFYFAGTRTAQTVVFDDAYTYDLYNNNGWGGTVPTPSGDYHTELVYESSNTNVVYYDNGLKIAAGARKGDTATVTVTAPASAEYLSATATFTVTIEDTKPVTTATYYKASVADVGYEYLVVSNGFAAQKGASTAVDAVAVTVIDNNTITVDDDPALLWEVEAAPSSLSDNGSLLFKNGSAYLYRVSNNGSATTLTTNTGTIDRYYPWSYNSTAGNIVNLAPQSNSVSHYFVYYNTTSSEWAISAYQTAETSSDYVAHLYTTREPQTLSFANATATHDLATGTTFSGVALSGAQTAVSYSSSDETVATVASNGTVTVLKKGTVMITATAAPSATLQGASASYELTITNSNVPTYYKADAIVVGESYLIVSNGYALRNNSGAVAADEVQGSGATIQFDAENADFWTASANGELTNNGQYLRLSSNGFSTSLSIGSASSTPSNNQWAYDADNSTIKCGNYYLYYSAGSNNRFTVSNQSGSTHVAALYTTTPPKTPQTLSYSPTSASYDLFTEAWTPSQPVLGGDYHTTVTYESSNDAIVEVVAGVLTPKAVGQATITATAPADATYAEATATCTITVTDSTPVTTGKTYTRISGSDALVTGTYLIAEKTDTYLYNASGANHGGYSTINSTAGVTREGTTITLTEDIAAAHEFVFTRTGNNLTIQPVAGEFAGKYMYATNDVGSTYINFQTAENTFTINPQSGDYVYFRTTKGTSSNEYLYKKATDSFFKLGGSGAPGGGDAGIYLYKLNDGGTTPDDPEPPTPTTQYYTKVSNTSALPTTTDAASGNYLIVYEDGEKAYVFKPICGQDPTGSGTSSSGHTQLTKEGSAIEVALTSDGIAATSAIEGCKIQMKQKSGSSSWYLYSPGIDWWLRINSSAGTLVAMTSSGYGCSFSFSGTGNDMTLSRSDGSATAYMRYSASNTYFEATTSSSTSHALSLYKLSE